MFGEPRSSSDVRADIDEIKFGQRCVPDGPLEGLLSRIRAATVVARPNIGGSFRAVI
jgi:hypothetical protein